jgi:hypothetical protein
MGTQIETECNMTFIQTQASDPDFQMTPQMQHINAVVYSEKAIRHHHDAARFLEVGDLEQANIHAKFARRHSLAALAACDFSPLV